MFLTVFKSQKKSISTQKEVRPEQRMNNSKFESLVESQNDASAQLREMCSNMQVMSKGLIQSQNELISTQKGLVSAQNDIKSNM